MWHLLTDEDREVLKQADDIITRIFQTDHKFSEPAMVKRYLVSKNAVSETDREEFKVLYLNNQHGLITEETLFCGTVDASPVYPRVVVQQALKYNAAAIILSHNHPSGEPEPSRADRSITDRLKEALTLIDVRILDHIIVGANSTVSFAERGYL